MLSLFVVIGRFLKRLRKSPSNTFEDNAYIGVSPTVKHEQRHEHHRQERRRQEYQHEEIHGENENQSDLHGRIRLARRQHRLIHEQASSHRDKRVRPMWDDDIDWDDDTPAVREPDWQDEVEWE